MIITLTPEDVIKRCLWKEYKKFCLHDKSENEIKEIVTNNQPFVISEDAAYVIGLLKIVETDNLIHRFNQHMNNHLQNKSNLMDGELYISRLTVLKETEQFEEYFPTYFKNTIEYERAIVELKQYIKKIYDKFSKLDITEHFFNEKKILYLKSKDIKKIIDI